MRRFILSLPANTPKNGLTLNEKGPAIMKASKQVGEIKKARGGSRRITDDAWSKAIAAQALPLDEEQPEGFPNPGAGFCKGLAKEQKP